MSPNSKDALLIPGEPDWARLIGGDHQRCSVKGGARLTYATANRVESVK